MKAYTKPTFMDRVKLAVIWIAIGSALMWLVSCEDTELRPLEGQWALSEFEIGPAPEYDAARIVKLEITISGSPYQVSVNSLLINGVSASVDDIQVNELSETAISNLTLSGQDFSIELNDCKFYQLHKIIQVSRIDYTLPDGTEGSNEFQIFTSN